MNRDEQKEVYYLIGEIYSMLTEAIPEHGPVLMGRDPDGVAKVPDVEMIEPFETIEEARVALRAARKRHKDNISFARKKSEAIVSASDIIKASLESRDNLIAVANDHHDMIVKGLEASRKKLNSKEDDMLPS